MMAAALEAVWHALVVTTPHLPCIFVWFVAVMMGPTMAERAAAGKAATAAAVITTAEACGCNNSSERQTMFNCGTGNLDSSSSSSGMTSRAEAAGTKEIGSMFFLTAWCRVVSCSERVKQSAIPQFF